MAMSECGSGSSPSEIECRQIAELLGDYFDGTLPRRTVELLEWHIDGCAPCIAFINTYRTTIAATRKLPGSGMPPELKKRLLQVLRALNVTMQSTLIAFKGKTERKRSTAVTDPEQIRTLFQSAL